MRMLNDFVHVRCIETNVTRAVKLLFDEPITRAVVINVGPGRYYEKDKVFKPTQVKTGEIICFLTALKETGTGKAICTQVAADEFIIRENDILGVIHEDTQVTKL